MQVAIGTYEHTQALKDGSVNSPSLGQLDFIEVSPITRAFRQMATQQAYDIAEMAIVTYMLARTYDKPIVGLPIVLVRSTLLPSLVTAEGSSITDLRDLNGKTLGIRSYTQTSGVWVRGMLQDAFGVDLSSLTWTTFEGSHLDEYTDPPNVTRAAEGQNMVDMVKSGELVAAIGVPAGDGLRSLVPSAAQAEAEWSAKSGVRTLNHILTVKRTVVEGHPNALQEITDLFQRARGSDGAAVPAIGIEPNRKAFETVARYAHEQGITPREMTIEELFPRE
ncbi:MAG: ABC transporter substrate-binding protein [Chloroflexota bacterium]